MDIKCSACGRTNPTEFFYPKKGSRTGFNTRCKECEKARANANYRKNPDKAKARSLARYKANPAAHRAYCRKRRAEKGDAIREQARFSRNVSHWRTHIIRRAKQSAASKGMTFNLTADWVEAQFDRQGGKCYWFGIEMVPSLLARDPQQPSLDRLDGDKGYTQENCVLTTLAANLGRGVASVDRWRRFMADIAVFYA